MRFITSRSRTFFRALVAFVLVLVGTAAAAAAVDSEGELAERGRLVGNLGIASADIGVYPDRAEVNPQPELSGGTTSVSVPDSAEIVQTLVYWAGRGADWADPNIVINGQSVDADIDYRWETPSFDQSTYVADITDTGIVVAGDTTLTVSGADQNGERFYGIGFLVVYEDASLPEVEVHLLEGNEFAFFNITFADDIGEAALHTTVNCTNYTPSIEDRDLLTFSRIMGVDAGRSDGPPRSQRYQWWTGTEPVVAPVVDGIVQVPSVTPQGSVDNPVTPRVASTSSWGSETFESTAVLGAGDTHHCAQVQSVNIGDGAGASLSQTNQGGAAEAVYRLGNLIWFDVDGDGMAEIGEPGVDGVTLELFRDGEDEPLATTVSSDDGSYQFEGLLCGDYRVEIPAGQAGWTVNGEPVDPSALVPSDMTNPNANDDSDNDNNGVAQDGAIVAGIITLGDCGDDGDFSNDASNEPTDEVDRKTGPDADPDDDAFEDVRSNASVDIGLTGPAVCDADGDLVVDGEEGVNGASATNCGDEDPVVVCDASGTIVDGPEGANGASAANCGDDDGDNTDVSDVAEAVCNEDGVVVVTAADGTETVTDTACNEDEANGVTEAVCNEDGELVITTGDGTEEAVEVAGVTCDDEDPAPVEVGGAIECPAGTDRAGEVVAATESCDEEEVTVEVQGATEEQEVGALAITGVTSRTFVLIGLIAATLGMWFAVAGAWFRPVGRRP